MCVTKILSLGFGRNRQELDNVLQCLSINDYSIFSLIDDILAYCDRDDIKLVREGIECDATDICDCLFSYVTSGLKRVLLVASMFPNVDELSVLM